jgi:RNA polymerase sigma-70 factor (ECF subfamily)
MPESDAEREAEWVRGIQRGDNAAFEALFLAYYERLVRFAYGFVKTRSTAEEVVQDLFLSVWTRRAQWAVHDTIRTYLYSATRNHALNWLRHGGIEQRWAASVVDMDYAQAIVPRSVPANEQVELAELDEAIRQAIDRLPPRSRETFILSRQHHLSYEQIAQVMDVSVKTVQEQIWRALRTLRVSLASWLE